MAVSLADELGSAFDLALETADISIDEEFGQDLSLRLVGQDNIQFINKRPDDHPLSDPTSPTAGVRTSKQARSSKSSSSYCTADTDTTVFTPPPIRLQLESENDGGPPLDESQLSSCTPLQETRGVQSPRPRGRPNDHLISRIEEPHLSLTESFISLSKSLDNIRTIDSDNASNPSVRLEAALQAHLHRLTESERVREQQCREFAVISREMGNITWEGVELDLIMGNGLGLGMFDDIGIHDDEWGIGWASQADEPSTEDVEVDPDQSLQSLDPDISLLSPGTSHVHQQLQLPPLRLATLSLITDTQAVIASLTSLSESLESTFCFSNNIKRQLKFIRAGIDHLARARDLRRYLQAEGGGLGGEEGTRRMEGLGSETGFGEGIEGVSRGA